MDITSHRRMVQWAMGMLGVALAVGLVVAVVAFPAFAAPKKSVDPDTLTPPPTPGVWSPSANRPAMT